MRFLVYDFVFKYLVCGGTGQGGGVFLLEAATHRAPVSGMHQKQESEPETSGERRGRKARLKHTRKSQPSHASAQTLARKFLQKQTNNTQERHERSKTNARFPALATSDATDSESSNGRRRGE
eukprot:119324-Rhodomonas_salina.1